MKWLSIIGLGQQGLKNLPDQAMVCFQKADILVSSERLFSTLSNDDRRRIVWSSEFSKTLNQILNLRPKNVCILATGDPMFFGIGSTLVRYLDAEEVEVIPGSSIFSLICAKMFWSDQQTHAVSLHGRPLNSLIRFLNPSAKLVVLSHDRHTPDQVAKLLNEVGYGKSNITVFENVGSETENISRSAACEFTFQTQSDFNSIALECISDKPLTASGKIPGLADHYFAGDGVMTKKPIRAITLSSLRPNTGEQLWDIGSGCGTIAIEWLRACEGCTAIAIEQTAKRIKYISKNAQTLGTPELKIIEMKATPDSLDDLPKPNAIFIGGGSSNFDLIEYCWRQLEPKGRLVINAVSVRAEQNLIKALDQFGGKLSKISIEQLQPLGSQHAWQPDRTITHYCVTKE